MTKEEYEGQKALIVMDLGDCRLQKDQDKIVDLWFRAIRLELQYQFGHNPQNGHSIRLRD
jgi:hypothetical protein